MNQTDKNNLRQLQVEIVEDVEPKDVLDQLYEEGILTENDCERISNGKTRKERCQLLMAMLPTRGPNAYGSFQRALANTYYNLKQKLSHITCGDFTSPKTVENGNSGMCEKCCSFLPELQTKSSLTTVIKTHCCLLYDSIEPTDLLDMHFQEYVLTEDDCERIRAGVTRRDRCRTFFQALISSTSRNVIDVFKRSLNKKYQFIVPALNGIQVLRSEDNNKNTTYVKGEIPGEIDLSLTNAKLYTENDSTKDVPDGSSPVFRMNESETTADSAFQKAEKDHEKNKARSKGKTIQKVNGDSSLKLITSNPSDDNCCNRNVINTSLGSPPVNPGALQPYQLPDKRIKVAFNYLSTLINQGDYTKFESVSSNLGIRYYNNPDMICMLSYLQASRSLFGIDFEAAKGHINKAFSIVPKTSNPKYFTIELFTAKTRMYITEKKLGKLQNTLDDAKMIIETDPVGCTGRAAGWLYMNDARHKTSQIAMINFRGSRSIDTYRKLHKEAKESFQRALTNFQQDGGKDGPFGFGFALCRLAILLLQCGDNGLTMDVLNPSQDDIELAEGYLNRLENSDIPIPKILDVHYLIAKCDYQYRRNNTVRALEYAQSAYDLSTEINMLEFTKHAHNRLIFLKTRTPLMIEEISDKQANEILFGSSDSITD